LAIEAVEAIGGNKFKNTDLLNIAKSEIKNLKQCSNIA
jgi:hypothetical protein